MSIQTDTIAAVATPAGPGAIGILRLSGPRAADIAAAVFRPLGKKGLLDRPVRTLVYGDLLDREGQVIDRVLCTYSRGPESYTGEDTAELHCHGSPMVLTLGLEALFAQGARQAGPGEFTQRAFLNGRLDLAQAEAVADLLDAQSREGARHAAGQLSGALSRRVGEIYSALVDLMAHFHAVLDYPDEDIDPFTQEQLARDLTRQETALERLLATYRRGRQLSRGVRCAIVGRPNAGKSSLLNALVGYERAIVTDIPGTTRDTVEENVELGGVPLRLIDTAGLRESADPIEQLGVERSRAVMEEAELILLVVDAAAEVTAEDAELTRAVAESGKPWIFVAAKQDLVERSTSVGLIGAEVRAAARTVELSSKTGEGLDSLARAVAESGKPWIFVAAKQDLVERSTSVGLIGAEVRAAARTVELSSKTGEGLDSLARAVAELFPRDAGSGYGELLTNARQAQAAQRALEGVRRAREALELGVTPDALLTDVEEALSALGELTGQSVREDVTARIFQRFCVGK